MMVVFVLLFLTGLVSGFLAGLLGIGGGLITVPALYYLLRSAGLPESDLLLVSVGTSLAATFVATLASTWVHHLKRAISWEAFRRIAPGLIAGSLIGALSSSHFPTLFIRGLFIGMSLLIGIYFFFPRLPHPNIAPKPNNSLALSGLLIGCLSSLLGIGGGLFTLPLFLGYQVPIRNAVATSSVSTLVTALTGTLIYLFIGWEAIPGFIGYIDIPALACIALGSLCTTALGVKLSHILPTTQTRKIFACILIATGISMFYR